MVSIDNNNNNYYYGHNAWAQTNFPKVLVSLPEEEEAALKSFAINNETDRPDLVRNALLSGPVFIRVLDAAQREGNGSFTARAYIEALNYLAEKYPQLLELTH